MLPLAPNHLLQAEVVQDVFGEQLYTNAEHTEFPSPEALQRRILLRASVAEAPILKSLVAVVKIGRKDMEEARKVSRKVETMSSVSVSYVENKVDAMLECNSDDQLSQSELQDRLSSFRTMARRHLVRVYPDGIRVDSSNFCPWSMWFAGASLATLNWQVIARQETLISHLRCLTLGGSLKQVWDRDVMTNLAFFRENGACGYVLKPQWLMNEPGHEMRWATLVAQPVGYRSGEPKRKGRVDLKMCVHGTVDNVRQPARESEPWTVARLKLKNGMDYKIDSVEPHRVCVAPEIGVLTVWIEHWKCDGMVCISLRSLRAGRWWFPVLNRNGVVRSDASHNDWLAMDVHLELLSKSPIRGGR